MSEYAVRLATPEDAAGVRTIYAPVVAETHVSFETDVPSVAAVRERIDAKTDYPWLVCVADGDVAAYAYGGPVRGRGAYRWAVETSVYVHPDYRRRGIARALYGALFDCLAHQGYVDAYAVTALPNPPTVALHEAMGFEARCTFEAVGYKHEEWWDVRWWHRPLCDRPDAPPEPRPVAAVRDDAAFRGALASAERALRD